MITIFPFHFNQWTKKSNNLKGICMYTDYVWICKQSFKLKSVKQNKDAFKKKNFKFISRCIIESSKKIRVILKNLRIKIKLSFNIFQIAFPNVPLRHQIPNFYTINLFLQPSKRYRDNIFDQQINRFIMWFTNSLIAIDFIFNRILGRI